MLGLCSDQKRQPTVPAAPEQRRTLAAALERVGLEPRD
jgi:hypothetical protein